jgi:hypothetical protein
VASRPDGGLGIHVLRVASALAQPFGLDSACLPLGEPLQRVPPPQSERLPAGVPGPLRFARREQLTGPQQEVLEAEVVKVVPVQGEPVPRARRDDRGGAEHLAQADDAALDDLGPRGREVFAPQRLRERLGPHGVAGTRGQRLEHHLVPGCQQDPSLIDLEGAEHRDAHTLNVTPSR